MSGSQAAGEPSVLDVLDAVDALVGDARRVPFSSNVVVNEGELTDLLDRIRSSLPDELAEAGISSTSGSGSWLGPRRRRPGCGRRPSSRRGT